MCIRDSSRIGRLIEREQNQCQTVIVAVLVEQRSHVASVICLLYTSDAADERSSVDLGGRRIIKKKKNSNTVRSDVT